MREEIKRGWRFSQSMQQRIDTANLSLVAAGGAFFSMLSVFPGIAAVVALMGFVADPITVQEQMSFLERFMPPDAFQIINAQVQRMVATSSSTLGWATVVSTLAALWSARKGTDALIRGLNAVYYGRQRNGWKAMALSFVLTIALSLVVVIALLALVVVPLAATILSQPFFIDLLPPEFASLINGVLLFVLRWMIALGVVFVGVWLLYRFAPNVKRTRTGIFTPGAIISIAVWGAATFGFSYYLSNFGNYSQVYGSIGAVVALLMFLYITIFVVLLGAALNAELEPAAEVVPEIEQEPAIGGEELPPIEEEETVKP